MSIKNQQSGFTLIELVVVIVILGILAATAIPRFVDLSDDAAQAAVEGVAGGVASAAAVNYAARKVNTANGTAITTCTQALTHAGVDTGKYTAVGTLTANVPGDCTITGPKGKTAVAKVIGE